MGPWGVMGLFGGTSSAEELFHCSRAQQLSPRVGHNRAWRAGRKQLPGVQCYSLLGFPARDGAGTRLRMFVCRRKGKPMLVELARREL